MFVVHFFERKTLLLSQLRKSIPAVGEELKIKGRKGKVSSVDSVEEKKIHVQVELESIKKSNQIIDPKKKKR